MRAVGREKGKIGGRGLGSSATSLEKKQLGKRKGDVKGKRTGFAALGREWRKRRIAARRDGAFLLRPEDWVGGGNQSAYEEKNTRKFAADPGKPDC